MPHLSLSYNALAQLAHVGWGLALVYTLYAFEVKLRYCLASVLAFAFLKEGVFDVLFESASVQGSGLEDFGFLALGAFLAVCVLLLTRECVWRRI